MWVVGVGGDDGELRPWHYIYIYSIKRRHCESLVRQSYTVGGSAFKVKVKAKLGDEMFQASALVARIFYLKSTALSARSLSQVLGLGPGSLSTCCRGSNRGEYL